jgi:hypothetical protein
MIIESNLVNDLLDRSSASEEDPSLRMQSTTLLIDLFYDESTVLSNVQPYDGQDVRIVFNENLKSGLQHRDKVYKLTIWGASFGLLDHLIEIKSAESPTLMRTMISAFTELVKNRHDRLSEGFILRNFHELFAKNLELVTLHLVLDPIVSAFSERIKGDRLNRVRPVSLSSDEIYFLLQISYH